MAKARTTKRKGTKRKPADDELMEEQVEQVDQSEEMPDSDNVTATEDDPSVETQPETEAGAAETFDEPAETVEVSVATTEDVTPGVFHKLTGALTGQGLEILSAEINTLEGGLVMDRFLVADPDFAGEPPPERLQQVRRAVMDLDGSIQILQISICRNGPPKIGVCLHRAIRLFERIDP
jgi:UTP:GlnB (protein PII) uridylyltransferase